MYQNNEKIKGRMHEDITETGCKRSKKNLVQNMGKKEHYRKAEWRNNKEKDLQGIEEKLKANIESDSRRATLKKVQKKKQWWHTWIIV